MQDLFLKLGLDPEATSAQILEAIEAKPGQSAAAEILLNDHRRAAYQRTVFTLRSIGQLRHRLGLDNEASWFLETCADFAPRMQSRKYSAKAEPGAETTTHSGPGTGSVAAAAPAATAPATTPSAAKPAAAAPATGARADAGPSPYLKPLLVITAVALLLIVLYFVF